MPSQKIAIATVATLIVAATGIAGGLAGMLVSSQETPQQLPFTPPAQTNAVCLHQIPGNWGYLTGAAGTTIPGSFPVTYVNVGVVTGGSGPASYYGLIDVKGTGFPACVSSVTPPTVFSLPNSASISLAAALNAQTVAEAVPQQTTTQVGCFLGFLHNGP